MPEVAEAAAVTGDVFSSLGADLSVGTETEGATETPVVETEAEGAEALEQELSADLSAEGTAETIAAPAAEGTPAATPAVESPYQLSEDGKSYIVPTADYARLDGLQKYAQEVQARYPTPADAERAYQGSSDFNAMQSDFLLGREGDIDAVLGFFSGQNVQDPGLRARYQQSFETFAARMPEALSKISPAAYDKFADSMSSRMIQAAYDRAVASGDPVDFSRAQHLDWGQTGRYLEALPQPKTTQVSETEQRIQQLEARESELINNATNGFMSQSVDGPKWKAFDERVDQILAPVKDNFDPFVFQSVKEEIKRQTLKKIEGDDWSRNHKQDRRLIEEGYRQIWRDRGSVNALAPKAAAFTQQFIAQVNRFLPSIAKPLLNSAAVPKKAAQAPRSNSPVPQAARAASAKPAVNGTPLSPKDQVFNSLRRDMGLA